MGRLGPSVNGDECYIDTDLLPRAPGLDIGSAANPWDNLYVNTIHDHGEAPTADNTYDLGTLLLRYRHLYLGSQLYLASGTVGAVAFRNAADSAFNSALWQDATDNTVLNAVTGKVIKFDINSTQVASIDANGIIDAGNLTFSAASAKIIPGATSLLFRNNADNATNLGITDAGVATIRAGLTVTAGGVTITAGGQTITAGDLTLTNGSFFSATVNKPWVNGLGAVPADITAISTPELLTFVNASGGFNAIFSQGANTANGAFLALTKSRATDGSADVIVQASDVIGRITAYGANGTTFDTAARIEFIVDGTPGASADMPGAIVFSTSPDGSATLAQALKIGNNKDLTAAGNLIFSALASGIQLQSGANGRTGTFTANGATPVVVGNTSLAAGDMIIVSRDTPAGTPGAWNITARTNGTSFTFTGTASDTSGFRYWLVRVN